jgi:hypothetical protein
LKESESSRRSGQSARAGTLRFYAMTSTKES